MSGMPCSFLPPTTHAPPWIWSSTGHWEGRSRRRYTSSFSASFPSRGVDDVAHALDVRMSERERQQQLAPVDPGGEHVAHDGKDLLLVPRTGPPAGRSAAARADDARLVNSPR
jgi:hypothetical protein